jgi:Tfp pilus assembly protein PilX
MGQFRTAHSPSKQGAALLIVLAMVVLLTGLAVAYLSRTTSDRQVAHTSFHQSRVDVLAQSAMDLVIGDLQQEIANGSTAISEPDGSTVYTPTAGANMVPQRRANAAVAPNLIRVSVRLDNPVSPGVGSRASAVNSTTDASANGRSITLARWNTHYLLPKYNTLNNDSYPPSPLLPPFNPYPAVPNGFTPPDWVFVAPDPNNPTQDARKIITSPNQLVIGRYAYAIYDEGGLMDMNVAGYPTCGSTGYPPVGSSWMQPGRKGSLAFADLTALGNYPFFNPTSGGQSVYQVDRLVGWRNYATTGQPASNNNFPDIQPTSQAFAKNFQTGVSGATSYFTYIINNTNGFLSPNPTATPASNGLTDQVFVGRKQLIAYQQTQNTNNGMPIANTSQFDVNALQYLSTFSRETNAPSFSPSTPAGSTIDYAALANTATAVNPNFLSRRVTTPFTRFDGTTAVVGEPLVKTRFPLSRLAWITYKGPSAAVYALNNNDTVITALRNAGVSLSTIQAGTAANVKACFGLMFGGNQTVGNPSNPWVYTNPTGAVATPANRIMRLDEVAGTRDPDFFELLQAGILTGSLGQNTNGGVTGQNNNSDGSGLVFPDIHMSNTTHHILTIGACIIDQADPDSIPTRIQFSPDGVVTWTAYGVENLPYITQLYPIAGTSPNNPAQWATYLLFELWNPHQNASTLPNNVRLRVDGAIGIFSGGNVGSKWISSATPQIIANGGNAGQSVILNSAFSFSAPFPLTTTNTTNAAPAPGPPAGGAFAVLPAIP